KRQYQRIKLVTSISEDRRTIPLLYTAKIGSMMPCITWDDAATAMIPEYFPFASYAIEINDKCNFRLDGKEDFFRSEQASICHNIEHQLLPLLNKNEAARVAVFALAPQPLLIWLGRCLTELVQVDVHDLKNDIAIYQSHREPMRNWKWAENGPEILYRVVPPADNRKKNVALNISLSANIANERITSVLGDDCSIWTLTIDEPYVDYLKTRKQLSAFRECYRKLLNRIKQVHGQTQLHIFPAVPVAIAVEIGRCWMPKADMPLIIYDQSRELGNQFVKTISLGVMQ
ncbi:MAG: SAVED domain-containing protein, partial [Kiritimatiellales bacterium]